MTNDDKSEPPSSRSDAPANDSPGTDSSGLMGWVRQLISNNKNGTSLRDAIEEYIDDTDGHAHTSVAAHERALLSNILKLRDMTVVDVMIPRADIAAIPLNTSQTELLSLLAEKQFSRLPVYGESLDDILGTIHIKDILACLAQGKDVNITELLREVPIVSPAMHVLDLLLMMKQMRKHLVLVIDEYGGIDGLATVGDLIESIVGDIEDEYDDEGAEPRMIVADDNTVTADARIDLDEFQTRFGNILTEEELEDNDTIGGLVFSLA
ncbi:MAG: CBS domain-containing protein, partial [Alphaproteobacteria bacterium]|nr:CBS domain-containing protein [Alphaproteobacteria bacterium]